jgi:hypothetical protein
MTANIEVLSRKDARAHINAAKVRESDVVAFKRARMLANAAMLATLHAGNPEWRLRVDARFRSNPGMYSARQLEQVLSEVERTDYPANNFLELIPMVSEVSPGAESFTIQRIDSTGKPKVHRGKGKDIPTVSLSMFEANYKVRPYVLGVEWDHFEAMSSDFANANMQAEMLLAARESHLQFANDQTAFGDEDNDIYGVANNPFVNKVVIATVFSEGTAGDLMLAALNRIANMPNRISKGTRRPNRLVVSHRIDDIISSTPRGAGTDLSVKEVFLRNNSHIQDIVPVHEFEGAGGADNIDIIFAYTAGDKYSARNVVPVQYTQLALQQNGYDYTIPTFMTHGGVVMSKPLGNVVAYVTVSES